MKPTIGVLGGGTLFAILLLVILLSTGNDLFACSPALPPGVVVEKGPEGDKTAPDENAVEQAREATPPADHSDHDDHLLLLFLLAGAAAGFIAGYFWRILTKEVKNPPGGEGEKAA